MKVTKSVKIILNEGLEILYGGVSIYYSILYFLDILISYSILYFFP